MRSEEAIVVVVFVVDENLKMSVSEFVTSTGSLKFETPSRRCCVPGH